jgi:ribose transport system ATP-binding protein
MIVQEAGTIPNITVAENIFLGHEAMFKQGPIIVLHPISWTNN